MLLQLGQDGARRQQEDAAVPVVVAALDVGLGGGEVGLLDEGLDLPCGAAQRLAAPDVAVARRRRVRLDAEQHQGALASGGQARVDGGEEVGLRRDGVVGRHDEDQGVRVLGAGQQGGAGDGGGRVPGGGLQHDGGRRRADLAQLLGDDEAVLGVGHDHDRMEALRIPDPQGGLLQHGARPGQRQELLGIALARERPQAGARTARQDHGIDLPRHARPESRQT